MIGSEGYNFTMSNEISATKSQQEVDLEFYRLKILELVDEGLALASGCEVMPTSKVQDLLLDIRLALST